MNEISIKSEMQMTSREIAELTGKRHKNVLRDIETIRKNLENTDGFNGLKFERVEYLDKKGEKRQEYALNRREVLLVTSKYSDELRLRIIDRMEFLENQTDDARLSVIEAKLATLERICAPKPMPAFDIMAAAGIADRKQVGFVKSALEENQFRRGSAFFQGRGNLAVYDPNAIKWVKDNIADYVRKRIGVKHTGQNILPFTGRKAS